MCVEERSERSAVKRTEGPMAISVSKMLIDHLTAIVVGSYI